MNLHEDRQSFEDLATITAEYVHIPTVAVKRDYYIVMMLQMLECSEYADKCVFKGGTSLSKCYPGSIERFSEDIDLTFIPNDELSKKQYEKALKDIEKLMSSVGRLEKIPEERNDRNKSGYVWFDDGKKTDLRVKLEIGSSIRPDPYEKKMLKTYIQEYLESADMNDVVEEYQLVTVSVNTLRIERTFLDKVMSVKRHAICGSLYKKVRHIYDVTMLYERDDIQKFLADNLQLKELIQKTKQTDSYYLEKRDVSEEYDSAGAYDFGSWKKFLDSSIEERYGSLHEDLLYTDKKQDFAKALDTFERISERFVELGE